MEACNAHSPAQCAYRVVSIALHDVLLHAGCATRMARPDMRGLRLDVCKVLVRHVDAEQVSQWGPGKACMPLHALLTMCTFSGNQLPQGLDIRRDFAAAGLMVVRSDYSHGLIDRSGTVAIVTYCWHRTVPCQHACCLGPA